ncbi:LytTR family DNA-binding domain-containing protein [uncultured Litoreibacter sp.]|uniref:LytTR family DNA-binding domain-containing protein n=1 Tax=uncultured Litoreibacter sp. TaxID=1392394 RepID=UPI002635B5FA|nr:LytTR family DNA-binding domain-containing protein [uncultured Litoreibacter sp.]
MIPEHFLPTLKQLICRPVTLVCWAVASIVLSVLNAFGAEGIETLGARLLYWGGILGLGIVFGALFSQVLLFIRRRWGLLAARLSGPLIIGGFLVPFIYGYNALFFSYRLDTLPGPLVLFLYGGLMYAGVILVMDAACYHFTGAPFQTIVVTPDGPAVLNEPEEEAQERNAPFLQRIGLSAPEELIRLAMQDHYVEVHTDAGSELILMRLADAIAELDGIAGLRVHRSHWVATDAVAGSRKEGGRSLLVMRDGALVPVSRSYRDSVKAAGLLG